MIASRPARKKPAAEPEHDGERGSLKHRNRRACALHRYQNRYPSMSTGCVRYFLMLPSRTSRAMPLDSSGMLENARASITKSW